MTAAHIVADLTARRQHLAVAESLTGGMVAAAITGVPGASAVFRAGIVAYTPRMKSTLVGVDAELIANAGVVSGEVASALATGVRERCGTDWGVGTTGAAGPEAHGGQPPGTVWIAVAAADGTVSARRLIIDGDRETVRSGAVSGVLALLTERLDVGAT
ncbi:MAG TPA: nicotinamide-nucleotide amidohydrolase family protein [Stackebrandtia sp.]|uniref:CinA family protein n=1 Tax=Stackebrandtia sp. TaxID=2023065 RepID=UPI002D587363|nr:nicotinamide-nucleotide amidohydrolase family protein [Stackebrandtia sp.]HZE38365.1 nicotinamide-nucleotide amidohydrolase family protein [Stackebrandtia sp.]